MKKIVLITAIACFLAVSASAEEPKQEAKTYQVGDGTAIQYNIDKPGFIGHNIVIEFAPKLAPLAICVVVTGTGISCFEPREGYGSQRSIKDVVHDK